MLRERSSDIASFVEHPAYKFSKFMLWYIIFIYIFLICYYLPKVMYKRDLFSKFLVLREEKQWYQWDHPVYSIFMLKIVVILVCRDQFITKFDVSKSFIRKVLATPSKKQWHYFFLGQLLRNILKVEQHMKFVFSGNTFRKI